MAERPGPTSLRSAQSVDGLRVRRLLGREDWHPGKAYGPDGWSFVHQSRPGSVIVSVGPMEDGYEWIHASIAWEDDMPTYADLTLLRGAVFGDGWSYQVFAPPSQHVSIHNHALHLWGRLDGASVLPDFTFGSGSI